MIHFDSNMACVKVNIVGEMNNCDTVAYGFAILSVLLGITFAKGKPFKLTRYLCSVFLLNLPGPCCSKLTTSLVNETLKFPMLISQL